MLYTLTFDNGPVRISRRKSIDALAGERGRLWLVRPRRGARSHAANTAASCLQSWHLSIHLQQDNMFLLILIHWLTTLKHSRHGTRCDRILRVAIAINDFLQKSYLNLVTLQPYEVRLLAARVFRICNQATATIHDREQIKHNKYSKVRWMEWPIDHRMTGTSNTSRYQF